MSYQIPRHINIATYATYLVMDTLMNLFVRQERKSMARFFNDCLAIVLVIAYARIDLSENTHWNLLVVTFSGGWIWPIIVVRVLVTQWWMDRSLGPRTHSFESGGDGIIVVMQTVTHTAHTVFMGGPAITTTTSGIPIWFWPSLYLFNIVFGLTLVLSLHSGKGYVN